MVVHFTCNEKVVGSIPTVGLFFLFVCSSVCAADSCSPLRARHGGGLLHRTCAEADIQIQFAPNYSSTCASPATRPHAPAAMLRRLADERLRRGRGHRPDRRPPPTSWRARPRSRAGRRPPSRSNHHPPPQALHMPPPPPCATAPRLGAQSAPRSAADSASCMRCHQDPLRGLPRGDGCLLRGGGGARAGGGGTLVGAAAGFGGFEDGGGGDVRGGGMRGARGDG